MNSSPRNKTVVAGENTAAKERSEAAAAPESLDELYREARAVASAYSPPEAARYPEEAVTDTNKITAIENLPDAIDDHVGTAWANDLLGGEFGKLAPQAIQDGEPVTANKALGNANQARAAAYGPAYEKYLSFKHVVREVHRPASRSISGFTCARAPVRSEEAASPYEEG
ncbi:hypothetical protein [Polyangium mundeleinium]|uniref:Uncharacterized protein n=1 Tax=Polyangium mundeleinium TaxID=2995306 RepID=A0ABT5F665_9BACT|nr:hypothetical protein [Polyangium mundeleinium]MDC0749069.1 hypothetical protein [Polyangium mundeleinium]